MRVTGTRENKMQNGMVSVAELNAPRSLAASRRKFIFSAALMLSVMLGVSAAVIIAALSLS